MNLSILDEVAPTELHPALGSEPPFEIPLVGKPMAFEPSEDGSSGSLGDLAVTVDLGFHPDHGALSWQPGLENRGSGSLGTIGVKPFRRLLDPFA